MYKVIVAFFITVLVSATGTVFAAEGAPDLSFGSSGVVTFNRGSNDAAHAVALQADGKMVIAGTISNGTDTDILILRLNNDGTPDPTFGIDGIRVFDSGNNDAARGVTVQTDGKIVVVGQTSNGTDTDILVLRRNANGAPDLTFNLSGSAVFDLSGNDTANAVAIQTTLGNRIVIAGTTSNGTNNDLLIMRLTSSGLRDTTFGSLGIVTVDRGGNDTGRAVAVQLTGLIVAAGTSANGLDRDIMVVRVAANGLPDTSFSSDGIAIVDQGGNETANAVAVDRFTGGIIVAGTSSNALDTDLMVVKLTVGGVPDNSFDGDGVRIIDRGGDDSGNAIALQTNGKIVVAGSGSIGADLDLIALRFSADGTLDTTFSAGGVAVFQGAAGGDDSGNAVALQTDGKVIVAGARSGNLNSDILVLRYTSVGVLDTTFSTTGVFTFRGRANTADAGNAVALQANGKIVVAGQTSNGENNDVLLLRFSPDGTRDTAFSSDGVVIFNGDGNGDDEARAVAVQSDGKSVVAGLTSNGANSDVLIMRLNADGTPDTTFSADGVVTFNGTTNGEDIGNAVAIQTDGKIIVVGQSFNGTDNDVLILRYSATGVLDTTFGTGGVATYDGGNNDVGRAVAVQTDGKIVVAGQRSNGINNDVIILRYDTNGVLDTTFGTGGVALYDSGNNDTGRAVALQTDGAIVVAGQRSNGIKNVVLVARFTSAGVLDATFSSDGIAGFNSGNPGDDIGQAVAVQADGKIVVAGITDAADVLLLRYLDSGELDGSFNTDGIEIYDGAANGIDAGRGIAIQPDGKIVVAGTENDDVLVLRYIGQKVRVITPNGGEAIPAGSTQTNYITWTAPPKAVTFTVELSLDGGTTWKTIAPNVTGTVLPSWAVPVPGNNKRQCLVRVTGFDADGLKVNADKSDTVFTIEVVKLTFPNGGESFTSGNPITITWTTIATKRAVASIKLSYTLNNGSTWNTIDTSPDPSDDGSFNWTAPTVSVLKKKARVKVVLKDSNNVTLGSDSSDNVFQVQPPPAP